MTALTHAQCIDAFEHITRNVMWQEDGDPLLKALANAGIDDILSLLILDEQQIDELKYDDSGTMTSLAPGHKNMVTIFLAYVCHRIIIGNPIIGNDYLSVTDADFEEYRQTDYMDLMMAAPTNPKAHDAVAGFFKGIQRQLNLFATLKLKKFQKTEEVDALKTTESESKVDSSSKPVPSLHATATPQDCDPAADFLRVIRHNSNLFLVLKDIKSRGEDNNGSAALTNNPEPPVVKTNAEDIGCDVDEDIANDTLIVDNPETVIADIADVTIEPLDTPAPRKSSRATSKPVRLGTVLAGKVSNGKLVTTGPSLPEPPLPDERSVTTEPSLPEPPLPEPPPEPPPPEPPPPL
jgi:hypothetical protein